MFIGSKYDIGQTYYVVCMNGCVKKVTVDAILIEEDRETSFRLSHDAYWYKERELDEVAYYTPHDAFKSMESEESPDFIP